MTQELHGLLVGMGVAGAAIIAGIVIAAVSLRPSPLHLHWWHAVDADQRRWRRVGKLVDVTSVAGHGRTLKYALHVWEELEACRCGTTRWHSGMFSPTEMRHVGVVREEGQDE